MVVRGHGRHYLVEAADGTRVLCHPRGKKSEAVVGDRVRWAPSGDEGVIEALEPRRNLLYRQDEWRSKSFAANVDQLLVLVAVEPVFSESLLSRALVAAAEAGMEARIGLNKTDLPAVQAARQRLAPYRAMGVPVFEWSLTTAMETALAELRPWLQGKSTVVLGPSGTGKSTLTNGLVPDAQAQVGSISEALNSGRHTTTHTQWYWIEPGTGWLDSPGFQTFGIQHVVPAHLASLMPDLASALEAPCRFANCTHRQEPGCSVRAAVANGSIHENRYRIYLELFEELSRPPHYG
ncbi:ribosome small subunit-dependent GTPase A [Inhella gelatinilytica]|uniref:ribosome small subunit-dependent GTPase A n=1 Tax=Inhella gelatinilytica TaxID=2795030 RepID=UPI001FE4231D|nr:ribosome small subunit-dependent GTPase A [Inhella gelatinilytica]